MSGIMESVDQHTNLAGQNRFELLLFYLNERQLFGINVFKVREVIRTPRLSRLPHAHPSVRGVAPIRGSTISVVDLGLATTGRPMADLENSSVIVTEYNRHTQGFLVRSVDRIVNLTWQDILPPPAGASGSAYLTGVSHVDDRLVQILDVEKVMSEVNGIGFDVSADVLTAEEGLRAEDYHVLVVDDSVVARRQIKGTLDQLGLQSTLANDGAAGLEVLQKWAQEGPEGRLHNLLMVISDIEMPRMDGYTLTSRIRSDDSLRHLHVMLHTSLSGVFNNNMVKSVGADEFLSKFAANELAEQVIKRLEHVSGQAVAVPV